MRDWGAGFWVGGSGGHTMLFPVSVRLDALLPPEMGEIETIASCSVSRSTSKQQIFTRLHLDAYPSLQQRARRPEMEPIKRIRIGSDKSLI